MTTATSDQPNGTQAPIARRVEFKPMAPIGTASTLKGMLETMKDSLAAAMPRHVTPDRLIKTMLVAANRQPELLQCTQASVIETVSRAAELGLDLSGTLGEAYAVPFNNRVKNRGGEDTWVKQCQLIIGYRGLAKLARQSGEIKRIEADTVHEHDDFEFEKGVQFKLAFRPKIRGDRGNPIGAYSLVEFKDGGLQAEFMAVADIEAVRKRSKAGSDKNGNAIGAWKSDWSEMAKKTVFRRLAKWMPLSPEKSSGLMRAMEIDNEDYGAEVVSVVRQTAEGDDKFASKGDALAARVRALSANDDNVIEHDAAGESEAEPVADCAAEPDANPEPAAEPGDISRHEQLAIMLADRHGATAVDAAAKLDDFARKLHKKPFANLSGKALDSIEAQIKSGDIAL